MNRISDDDLVEVKLFVFGHMISYRWTISASIGSSTSNRTCLTLLTCAEVCGPFLSGVTKCSLWTWDGSLIATRCRSKARVAKRCIVIRIVIRWALNTLADRICACCIPVVALYALITDRHTVGIVGGARGTLVADGLLCRVFPSCTIVTNPTIIVVGRLHCGKLRRIVSPHRSPCRSISRRSRVR